MRITVISVLIILILFYPSTYVPAPVDLFDQLIHKRGQVGKVYTDWLLDQPSAWADTADAGEKDYCNDPDLKLQWEFLIRKYPEDMGLHALHALRLGLCLKVERNDISLDAALKIFEDVKKSFVEKKIDELLEGPDEKEKDIKPLH